MSRRAAAALVAVALALVVSGCSGSPAPAAEPGPTTSPSSAPTPSAVSAQVAAQETAPAAPAKKVPLRAGEQRQVLKLAEPYSPKPPNGVGTDDYHCFLLDPALARDTAVTGYDIRPQNRGTVHHVILFRVPPDTVAAAEQKDAATPGDGWTCFGSSGLESGPGAALNDSGWLGAWAPGGGERTYGRGLGTPLPKGSRIIVQIHYNLLAGHAPDQSSVVLRETRPGVQVTPLTTVLLPAPVELPCRPESSAAPLCDRATALADVKKRFGADAGSTADLLHFLCGPIRRGSVQTCDRRFPKPMTIRGAAGHMHLLGTSIKIEVNPGGPDAQTVLDIPVWDFDNQGAEPTKPIRVTPADTVRVTCHHAQFLRDQQPSFEKQRKDRYVVWGEGSTDEMCLGMLLVTD